MRVTSIINILHQSSPISFSGRKKEDSAANNSKPDTFEKRVQPQEPLCKSSKFKIRTLPDIPCACCGRKMLTNKQLNEFVEKIKDAKDGELIHLLTKNSEYLRPTEKLVAQELVKSATYNSNCNLENLVQISAKEHKAQLEIEQKKVLQRMKKSCTQLLDKQDVKKVESFIDIKEKSIQNDKHPFKRKDMLYDLVELGESLENKEGFKEIYKIAESLPTSGDSMDAFFVKYSRRSSSEIAYRLAITALTTAEHIHPHSLGGENKASNYLGECGHCNSRRGNMSYLEWLQIEPDMPHFTQEYFDVITPITESGQLGSQYIGYARAAAKTLFKESGGLIDAKVKTGQGQGYRHYIESLEKTKGATVKV